MSSYMELQREHNQYPRSGMPMPGSGGGGSIKKEWRIYQDWHLSLLPRGLPGARGVNTEHEGHMRNIYVHGLKSTLHVQCQGATAIVSWMESQSSLNLCTATPTSAFVHRGPKVINMSCIFTFIIHSAAFLVTRADVAQGKVLLCLRYTPLSNYLLSSQLLFFALQEFSNFVKRTHPADDNIPNAQRPQP
jgi:hypothetical protein